MFLAYYYDVQRVDNVLMLTKTFPYDSFNAISSRGRANVFFTDNDA